MKRCVACGAAFNSDDWTCVVCGHSPELKQGFRSFATAQEAAGFQPGFFPALAALEGNSFWFQARNRLIVDRLERFFGRPDSFLEVGCGTGFVLSAVARRFPGIRLAGSEYFVEGLPFARERVARATLIQADARDLPFVEEFDVVGAFDVLEHIEDDRLALASICRAVRPGGGIILTVPQHRWLWSATDDGACHQRRYTRDELAGKLQSAGFTVAYATSFVSLLLPVMVVHRLAGSAPKTDSLAGLRLNPVVNACFGAVMKLERLLIRSGASLPCGGSLLMIGSKP